MARILLVWLALLVGCPEPEPPPEPTPAPTPEPGAEHAWWCPADAVEVEARVQDLLGQMNLEEKILQMSGGEATGGLWPTNGVERLGVPGFRMADGPRGVGSYVGPATAFPVGMARGATWDPELERAVGRAMGAELAAYGGDVLLAPTINILRHPRWGRAQETYGEDPLHVGLLGAAFIEGAQEHVLASVKHYAANSIENTRFTVDVTVDERALREVYLPAFDRAVRGAGVATVMSAYNSVNGAYCSENAPLLHDVLRAEWGFPGVVESDWVFGMHDTASALEAGLDIEMPFARVYGDPLRDIAALREELVDRAVGRILRTQLCFGLDGDGDGDPTVLESAEHKALSREVAARSAVLLRNDGTLPLTGAGQLAVVGPYADVANIGDSGSSSVSPSAVVTLLEGISADPGDWTLVDDPEDADVVVVAAGLSGDHEGESLLSFGDRVSLALPEDQQTLIAELAAGDAATVVLLHGGSAILDGDWSADVDALAQVFYPGDQGGHALADLVFGRAPFAGRLPFSVPAQESDLPPFDNDSDAVTYGLWHGHRHLLREGLPAAWPFGFGLSTTTFAWGAPSLEAGDVLRLEVPVANTGSRAGWETVQVYAEPPLGALDRAPRELVGWTQVALEAGEEAVVAVEVPRDRLAIWDGGWTTPGGTYRLVAAAHAEDPGQSVELDLP